MRNPLPTRRRSETFEIVHADQAYFVTTGQYDDGSVGEVFVQAEITSSQVEWLARDAAILISLAMQFGCPLETMRHTLTREEDGAPSTVMGALLDVLAADTGINDQRASR